MMPDKKDWPGDCRTIYCACFFCGSRQVAPAVARAEDWYFKNVTGEFSFSRCGKCRSLVLADPLKPEYLELAYATYYTHEVPAATPRGTGVKGLIRDAYIDAHYAASGKLWHQLGSAVYRRFGQPDHVDWLYRYASGSSRRILDYGFGDGVYLDRMRAIGKEVAGVEFDPVAVKAGRDNKFDVYTPDQVPDGAWSGSFDHITLSHVIEHVPDPRSLLQSLASWLAPGGALYIECPNAEATGLDIFGRFWRGLEVPRHLGIPSYAGLESALNDVGLEIVENVRRRSDRANLWSASCAVALSECQDQLAEQCGKAPVENVGNAEFLAVLAKPIRV